MKKITPCLWFNNCALQAAKYYVSIFLNSEIESIQYKTNSNDTTDSNVLIVLFKLNGQEFIGMNGGDNFKFTEAISFSITCKDQEEIDYYWNTLTKDGEEVQCGWLKDKFGLSWQVVPEGMETIMGSKDQEIAKRRMEKMLGMKKLVIKDLINA